MPNTIGAWEPPTPLSFRISSFHEWLCLSPRQKVSIQTPGTPLWRQPMLWHQLWVDPDWIDLQTRGGLHDFLDCGSRPALTVERRNLVEHEEVDPAQALHPDLMVQIRAYPNDPVRELLRVFIYIPQEDDLDEEVWNAICPGVIKQQRQTARKRAPESMVQMLEAELRRQPLI